MIVVGNQETTYELDGVTVYRLRNLVAWQPRGPGVSIVGVGGPERWAAAGPLPPDTVVTDLVEAALTQPDVAAKLWRPLLSYVETAANISGWRNFITTLRMICWRMRVRVDIVDEPTRRAIAVAIRKAPSFRFRIIDSSSNLRMQRTSARRRA